MDKLNMQTKNLADDKFEKLKELFPNAITETIDENGKIVRAIDKDILSQEISREVVEGRDERYQFTWPDKRKAILASNAPTTNTLRPCREESVNFDDTENLYIEGDNLEVLKQLQETYLGKVKMIYIDPPYNTGKDFVYNDDFRKSTDEFLAESGQYDEEGNRLEKNLESNGRFHTDWLNMMYPRLKLARNLLTDDGVIFISIDDNELSNMKKICDEVFGNRNFIATIAYQGLDTIKNDAKYFSNNHEYILCFSKNILDVSIKGRKRTEEHNKVYKNLDNDPKGPYLLTPLHAKSGSENSKFEYTFSNGEKFLPPQGTFNRFSKATLGKMDKDGEIYFGSKIPQKKTYLKDLSPYIKLTTFWDYKLAGSTRQSNKEISSLIGKGIFQNTKPIKLLKIIIDSVTDNNSIALDFFSGSSTTAHAVMKLNAEDGGNRKFIMVQLPEETDKKSEAYKAGYKNICEIGKERIRRAGKKILEENKDKEGIENLDIGFRVLKVDTSNMKDVYYSPEETSQSQLDMLEDNVKEDRTSEDLLFQVMLDLGISLSSKIAKEDINGKEIHTVEDNFLITCFDKDVDEEVIKNIARRNPYYVVFRDLSMENDSIATNFEQIFKSISPETIRRVI